MVGLVDLKRGTGSGSQWHAVWLDTYLRQSGAWEVDGWLSIDLLVLVGRYAVLCCTRRLRLRRLGSPLFALLEAEIVMYALSMVDCVWVGESSSEAWRRSGYLGSVEALVAFGKFQQRSLDLEVMKRRVSSQSAGVHCTCQLRVWILVKIAPPVPHTLNHCTADSTERASNLPQQRHSIRALLHILPTNTVRTCISQQNNALRSSSHVGAFNDSRCD